MFSGTGVSALSVPPLSPVAYPLRFYRPPSASLLSSRFSSVSSSLLLLFILSTSIFLPTSVFRIPPRFHLHPHFRIHPHFHLHPHFHPRSTDTSDTAPLPSSWYVLRYICEVREQQPARAGTQSAGSSGIESENGRHYVLPKNNCGTEQSRFSLRRK